MILLKNQGLTDKFPKVHQGIELHKDPYEFALALRLRVKSWRFIVIKGKKGF